MLWLGILPTLTVIYLHNNPHSSVRGFPSHFWFFQGEEVGTYCLLFTTPHSLLEEEGLAWWLSLAGGPEQA